jgi:hypothetical protein
MKIIYDNKMINRMRDYSEQEYIYFYKLPAQLKHSLLVTDFYRELHKKYGIVDFKIEPKIDSIRPDAVFAYKKNNYGYVGVLEVELSKKGFDINKYNSFYKIYQKYFPVMPTVFIVSDNLKLDGLNPYIKVKILNTKLEPFC